MYDVLKITMSGLCVRLRAFISGIQSSQGPSNHSNTQVYQHSIKYGDSACFHAFHKNDTQTNNNSFLVLF